MTTPWTAPPVERTVRPYDLGGSGERRMLEGRLTWHRETLLTKCAGLTPAQLARTTARPSHLTLLGLVRHMAEVERWWLRRRLAGEDTGDVFTGPDDGDEGIEGVEEAFAQPPHHRLPPGRQRDVPYVMAAFAQRPPGTAVSRGRRRAAAG